MYIAFGCLFALLIIIFFIAINFISSVLSSVWDIVTYCWDSLCNLFLPKNKRKKTENPFNTHHDGFPNNSNTSYNNPNNFSSGPQGKIFSASDGEYIDFEEIK